MSLTILHPEKIYLRLYDSHYSTASSTPTGAFTSYGEMAIDKRRMSRLDSHNSKYGSMILENKPVIGFRISKTSLIHGWNYTQTSTVYIEDPRGFEIPISTNNLIQITSENTVIDGYINVPCVWGLNDSVMVLLPVTSKPYKDALINTERKNTKTNMRAVKPGNRIELQDGRIVTYYGSYYELEYAKSEVSDKLVNYYSQVPRNYTVTCQYVLAHPKKKHVYQYWGDRTKEVPDKDKFFDVTSRLQVSSVIDDTVWTAVEAEQKLNDAQRETSWKPVNVYVTDPNYTMTAAAVPMTTEEYPGYKGNNNTSADHLIFGRTVNGKHLIMDRGMYWGHNQVNPRKDKFDYYSQVNQGELSGIVFPNVDELVTGTGFKFIKTVERHSTMNMGTFKVEDVVDINQIEVTITNTITGVKYKRLL